MSGIKWAQLDINDFMNNIKLLIRDINMEKYLKLTGGTMTGTIDFKPSDNNSTDYILKYNNVSLIEYDKSKRETIYRSQGNTRIGSRDYKISIGNSTNNTINKISLNGYLTIGDDADGALDNIIACNEDKSKTIETDTLSKSILYVLNTQGTVNGIKENLKLDSYTPDLPNKYLSNIFYINAISVFKNNLKILSSSYIDGNLNPADSLLSLGNNSNRWNNGYFNTISDKLLYIVNNNGVNQLSIYNDNSNNNIIENTSNNDGFIIKKSSSRNLGNTEITLLESETNSSNISLGNIRNETRVESGPSTTIIKAPVRNISIISKTLIELISDEINIGDTTKYPTYPTLKVNLNSKDEINLLSNSINLNNTLIINNHKVKFDVNSLSLTTGDIYISCETLKLLADNDVYLSNQGEFEIKSNYLKLDNCTSEDDNKILIASNELSFNTKQLLTDTDYKKQISIYADDIYIETTNGTSIDKLIFRDSLYADSIRPISNKKTAGATNNSEYSPLLYHISRGDNNRFRLNLGGFSNNYTSGNTTPEAQVTCITGFEYINIAQSYNSISLFNNNSNRKVYVTSPFIDLFATDNGLNSSYTKRINIHNDKSSISISDKLITINPDSSYTALTFRQSAANGIVLDTSDIYFDVADYYINAENIELHATGGGSTSIYTSDLTLSASKLSVTSSTIHLDNKKPTIRFGVDDLISDLTIEVTAVDSVSLTGKNYSFKLTSLSYLLDKDFFVKADTVQFISSLSVLNTATFQSNVSINRGLDVKGTSSTFTSTFNVSNGSSILDVNSQAITNSSINSTYSATNNISINTMKYISMNGGTNGGDNFIKMTYNNSSNKVIDINANTLNIASNTNINGKLTLKSSPVVTNSADYAEMFEWEDGNLDNEDRYGYFVELEKVNNSVKIKKANKDTNIENIIGITSKCPSIISDGAELEWKYKYKKDIFGMIIKDENNQPILSDDYDNTLEYIPRSERQEWIEVGMLGKIVAIDDGSCVVGGKCLPNELGIATKSSTGYFVLERRDETHILVLIK